MTTEAHPHIGEVRFPLRSRSIHPHDNAPMVGVELLERLKFFLIVNVAQVHALGERALDHRLVRRDEQSDKRELRLDDCRAARQYRTSRARVLPPLALECRQW